MTTSRNRRPLSRNERREGAAMLVVMALLLIVTATATLAIHSTSGELRGTGHARQRMQTRYLAEGSLVSAMTQIEQSGPEALAIALERAQTRTGSMRRLAPEEPVMAPTTAHHRIEMSSFIGAPGVVGPPVVTGSAGPGGDSLGHGLGYVPAFVVDVNDTYRFTGVVAGHRSDGQAQLDYMALTLTARGRTQPPERVDAYSPAAGLAGATPHRDDWTVRGFHESASNSRALGIIGPTRRR